jgi:N-6 DNA Methylase
MAAEPELRAHQEWLGFVQPVGLVVSPAALLATQTYVQRNIVPQQQILQGLVRQEKIAIGSEGEKEERPVLPDLPEFCIQFLGWRETDIIGHEGAAQIPDTLKVALADYCETLAPTYAVPDPDQNDAWVLLIQTLKRGTDLDSATKQDDRHWHATPQARFERLLRETKVPIGLLFNHTEIRLVYTPSGESTGYLTFPIKAMCEVAGRPIAAALHMLLSAERLFTVETARRLPAILRESRKYQNEVSTALADQVLAALNELLRGFQAANEASKNVLLDEVLASDPNHVYGGLLTSLMRLVFILYAEDRGLLSSDSVYVNSYSVEGLFERLREDAARYPDNMDGRYGAWAQLLTLFRLIYDGAKHGAMHLPARHGKLFDPDAYPFLEGRPYRSMRGVGKRLQLPRVSDGVIHRVLTNLLLLDGERLSYRSLDVEQIGSVYEAMMGYEIQIAEGPSVGLRPENVVVNMEEVLRADAGDRQKLLRELAGCELSGQALEQLKSAKKTEELLAALGKKISGRTHYVVAKGGMFLQPTDERRRSGSDYTPRSLTEPIVRTTLRPIFDRLGEHPKPEQILDLKICDPAMGSGAFLVEVCRFLGDKLVDSWNYYKELPAIPPDEDPSLYARRLVAQRCLYGVDVNPFAADLAKLSLWLATLAKDHPFTFLDHALRCGDSLVGFDRVQIAQFHWDKSRPHERVFGQEQLEKAVDRVTAYRKEILDMTEDNVASILLKQQKLGLADQALETVRRAGDLLVAPFFSGAKDKERDKIRVNYRDLFLSASKGNLIDLQRETEILDRLHSGKSRVRPFHWEIEFPEVFSRPNAGFDAIVGNPPFMGGTRISAALGKEYLNLLAVLFEGSGNRMDLVAYFFRRSFGLVHDCGTSGLIATKTIAQGDTRSGGLRWICNNGGTIFAARRRLRWPGEAAVVVSVIHIAKGPFPPPYQLDGKTVPLITAFLFYGGGNEDPARLLHNLGKCSIGTYLFGSGFTFDDGNKDATPISEMENLIRKNPRNQERVFPYMGGEELSESPTLGHSRFVIDFAQMPEAEARKWPDLFNVLEAKVRPYRLSQAKEVADWPWWQFWRVRSDLYQAIASLPRVLALCRHSSGLAFGFLPPKMVYADSLAVFAFSEYSSFAVLQSRLHEVWARFLGSSIKDDLRYTPSDCFETFPFPENWKQDRGLEVAGEQYYQYRASLMIRNNAGFTKTYHCFHDPEEKSPDILRLRELHASLDRAVLDAYGWHDVQPVSEFILDYEEPDDGENGTRKRKKPWRYRWPDEIRDEVLARLLELNRVRAQEEQLSGTAAEAHSKVSAVDKARKNKRGKVTGIGSLLADVIEEGKS